MAVRRWFRTRWDRWWAEQARVNWQQRQPASYSLNLVQYTTTLAKWLAGLSGAAVVLSFAFFIPAYLSMMSIKDDCASQQFIGDALGGAVHFLEFSFAAGALALLAIVWPVFIGWGRNNARWKRGYPPLRPGQPFDGWSERRVGLWSVLQGVFVVLSAALLIFLVLFVIFGVGRPLSTPEGVQKWWHHFELKCIPPVPQSVP
jgi:hypothetical protein